MFKINELDGFFKSFPAFIRELVPELIMTEEDDLGVGFSTLS